jgi:hypothetical protein
MLFMHADIAARSASEHTPLPSSHADHEHHPPSRSERNSAGRLSVPIVQYSTLVDNKNYTPSCDLCNAWPGLPYSHGHESRKGLTMLPKPARSFRCNQSATPQEPNHLPSYLRVSRACSRSKPPSPMCPHCLQRRTLLPAPIIHPPSFVHRPSSAVHRPPHKVRISSP